MNLQQLVRQRSKEEWHALFLERWTRIRIFVQENGEKASVIAFVMGLAIVLFFKLFIFLFCIAVLAYLVIMVTAESKPIE